MRQKSGQDPFLRLKETELRILPWKRLSWISACLIPCPEKMAQDLRLKDGARVIDAAIRIPMSMMILPEQPGLRVHMNTADLPINGHVNNSLKYFTMMKRTRMQNHHFRP